MKPYQRLQRYWRANRASRVETVEQPPQAIERLVARYRIRVPEDFREYLLHSCPRDDFAAEGCPSHAQGSHDSELAPRPSRRADRR